MITLVNGVPGVPGVSGFTSVDEASGDLVVSIVLKVERNWEVDKLLDMVFVLSGVLLSIVECSFSSSVLDILGDKVDDRGGEDIKKKKQSNLTKNKINYIEINIIFMVHC